MLWSGVVHCPDPSGLVGGACVWYPALPPLSVCRLLPVRQEGHRLLDEGDTSTLPDHHFHGGGEILQESSHLLCVHLIETS